jgi:hypothetical protein
MKTRSSSLWLTLLLALISSGVFVVMTPLQSAGYRSANVLITAPPEANILATVQAEGQATIEAQVNAHATQSVRQAATMTRVWNQNQSFSALRDLFGSTATAYQSEQAGVTATWESLQAQNLTRVPLMQTANAQMDSLRGTATAAAEQANLLLDNGIRLTQVYDSATLGLALQYPNDWRVIEKNDTLILITSLDAANFLDGDMPNGEFVILLHLMDTRLAPDAMTAALAEADTMTGRMKLSLEGSTVESITVTGRAAALVTVEAEHETLLSLALDAGDAYIAASIICHPRDAALAAALIQAMVGSAVLSG